MKFHIITLHPALIESYFAGSILGRAIKDGKISVHFYNPRAFTKDKHRRVDRRPYGGGPGMVMEALPVLKAVEAAKKKSKKARVIFFSPGGTTFDTAYAKKIAKRSEDIILIAGHYEGVDARVQKILKAQEVSVGPYVLTGGELPAAVFIDAVARFIPHVLGNDISVEDRRVSSPQVYTRPETLLYKGKKYRVPKVLLSGNHRAIDAWKLSVQGKKKRAS